MDSPLKFHKRLITADIAQGVILSDTDGEGKTTSFKYDDAGRLTKVIAPEGNAIGYEYDGRGNITVMTAIAKDGSSFPMRKLTYPDQGTPATCDKPTAVTDGEGHTTNFTYDQTHGGILTIDQPEVDYIDPMKTGNARPHTEYGYAELDAPGGGKVHREKTVFTCRSKDCTGAMKVGIDRTYGASGGHAIAVISEARGASDGSLFTATNFGYDDLGNLVTVDGPLSGDGDTTRYRYDAARRVIGIVGPDRGDGRSNAATRISYTDDGLVSRVEQGVVKSRSDDNWGSFTALHTVLSEYNGAGLKSWDKVLGGSTEISMTAYSYDADGRPDCIAVRMNPAKFGDGTGACDLTETAGGRQDRIQRFEYDNNDRTLKIWSGYLTDDARAELTSYTDNGRLKTVTDGNNNTTNYSYDRYDRLVGIQLPNPATSGDVIGYDYDLAGNMKLRYLRQTGQYQKLTYDAANRLVKIETPHVRGANDREVASDKNRNIAYDLSGQAVSFTEENNNNVSLAYDALGNLIQQWTPFGGAKRMAYDPRGLRTSLTWNDGFFVTTGIMARAASPRFARRTRPRSRRSATPMMDIARRCAGPTIASATPMTPAAGCRR